MASSTGAKCSLGTSGSADRALAQLDEEQRNHFEEDIQ
jgi:hypothetical protein